MKMGHSSEGVSVDYGCGNSIGTVLPEWHPISGKRNAIDRIHEEYAR